MGELEQSILDDPACDTLRLAYADWLEENGDAARAAFVRFQLRPTIRHPIPRVHWRTWFDPYWKGRTCVKTAWHDGPCTYLMRIRSIGSSYDDVDQLWVKRGFVSTVVTNENRFVRLATGLFARHPITQVRITGFRPTIRDGRWRIGRVFHTNMSVFDPSCVNGLIYAELADAGAFETLYETEAEAREALSLACVRFGRKAAKLKELNT